MKSIAAHSSTSSLPPSVDKRAGKYLCFRLGKEDFAIHVARVREIMPMQPLTVAPGTPAEIKGVMNLRGNPIPVVDLRLKLGAPGSDATPRTSIIVVKVESAGDRLLIGMIVDSVSEVLTLKSGEIGEPSRDGGGSLAPYLIGVAKVKGKTKFLLDSNLVLTAREIANLDAVAV